MKLHELKEIFFKAFALQANASNARQVLKDNGVTIVRHDFRCTKTWEQLLNAFGLLDFYKARVKKMQHENETNSFRQRQRQFIDELNKQFATAGASIPDIDSYFWDDDYR